MAMLFKSLSTWVRMLVAILVLAPMGCGVATTVSEIKNTSIERWETALRERAEIRRRSGLSGLLGETPSKDVQDQVIQQRLYGFPERLKSISIRAGKTPRKLPRTSNELPGTLQNAIAQSFVVSLLYYDGERIKYDWRRKEIPPDVPIWGFSMSKSVTSYLLGQAYCDGRIDSLNDPVKKYVESLDGTFYGDARIIDALNMTTGDGKIYESLPWRLRSRISGGTENVYQALLLHNGWTMVDVFKAIGQAEPGARVYDYKGPNTGAIGMVVASVAHEGFSEFAGKALADDAGLLSPSRFLVDPSGMPLAHAWFYATRTDWVRIGIRIAQQYRSPGCMGDYLRNAVAQSVHKGGQSRSRAYGRFFHLSDGRFPFPHMAMVGRHGQRLYVDLRNDRVWVIHSIRRGGSRGVLEAVVQ